MKLNNGQNIITDNDITMTGLSTAGHSLNSVINKQEEDISTLKSNVKWMFKYGGVGSGGTGGSGTGPSRLWNYKVEINDEPYNNGDTANLGKEGIYKLALSLFKVQGRTFNIKITYPTRDGIKIIERVILPTAPAKLEEYLDLHINGNIKISINDDEGNLQIYELEYIVTAYQFRINYVLNDANHTLFTPNKNNIFINAVGSKGLKIELDYQINTETEEAYFIYTDWSGKSSQKQLFPDTHGKIYLDLGKDLTPENSGNYSFLIDIHIRLKNNPKYENIDPLKLQDNLIPDSIYLKVESDGTLYSDNLQSNPDYKFFTGTISFKITPFQGYLDTNSLYELHVYVDDVEVPNIINLLADQVPQIININTNKIDSWNKITFTISRKNDTFSKDYYFFTTSPLGDFTWYPTKELNGISKTIFPTKAYQYHASGNAPVDKFSSKSDILFRLLNDSGTPVKTIGTINKLMQDKASLYKGNFDENEFKQQDFMFSVGLKYNKLNDLTKPILRLKGKNSSNNIEIYQDKIILADTSYKIYYPKDNEYHFLTLYRRAVNDNESNNPVFEFNVYIDGILEASTANFLNGNIEVYNELYLLPGLYSINYIDLSYFKHTPGEIDITQKNHFEAYNLNPNKVLLDYFNDQSILFYYYSYKLSISKNDPFTESFKKAYTYASNFYVNYKTNRIEVNYQTIQDISKNTDIPILVMEYIEFRENNSNWKSDGEKIFKWMEDGYDITTNSDIIKETYPINIYWANGKGGELAKVNTHSANAKFEMVLQGTSTLNYRNKNFDLLVTSDDPNNTFLYSPNFNPDDSTTFLPETRFTLKADIVDSSHSNNNSLGKFINTVTTKFKGAQQSDSKYAGYIKNTLEGFPFLLFFKNCYYVNNTIKLPKEDYYFLGIYNFNLGRDSEFNLGYKDLRLLSKPIPSGFDVISIPNIQKIGNQTLSIKEYLQGFGVAEIRENRNYFDFSQYDDSILFPVDKSDNDYMFGKMKSNSKEKALKPALRDLVKGVSKASGYLFDSLKKNMLETGGYKEGYTSTIPQNLVPNYKIKFERYLQDAKSVLVNKGVNIPGTSTDLIEVILGTRPDEESQEYYNPLVDYKSLSEYYVCCMALGLVDSVMKNLNLKTWNNKTFYASFYDMDTALGKDNAGFDTNYMAFSDYWKAQEELIGSKIKLLPAMSYKDWSDPNFKGYDIPMTYLLALAKYSYHVSENELLADWYPNNIWARFRRKESYINGWIAPEGYNSNHIACLTNADSFINNFFKKHLDTIPDIFFNLNYRKKYFVTLNNGLGYVNEDYSKFSGRRIYSVHDWLEGRFHMLDLYFNIANVPDSIKSYNLETEKWVNQGNKTYMNTDNKFIDKTNEDIIVIQDIFNEANTNRKYSNNIEVEFSSETNSPLSLQGAIDQRAIAENNQKQYLLQLSTRGQSQNLGGSKNWITIDKIDSLIQGDSGSSILYINSEKLTNLVGKSGYCGNWQITLPALQTVSLTSNNYTGSLIFKTSEYSQFPNLQKINISGSALGLDIDNINVSEILADNVSSANDLSIINCKRLNTISYKNSRFKSIKLSSINKISYFNKNGFKKKYNELKKIWEDTNIKSDAPLCKYLDLRRDAKDGIVFISDQNYQLNGTNEGIEEITLKGYKEIYINNCRHLNKLTIQDPETVEVLRVIGCSENSIKSLQIGQIEKTLDLIKFINLKNFSFNSTKNFEQVNLPDDMKLEVNCFYYSGIRWLKGKHIQVSPSVFHQSRYTLLDGPKGNLTDLYISPDTTDLHSLFSNTNIEKKEFDNFNYTYQNQLTQLTNTSYMWSHIGSLHYDKEMLLEDYINGKCRFDLSMYTNVLNAEGMLGGPGKTAVHPDMFNNFGASGVSIRNILGWNENPGKIITLSLEWLYYIADRVSDFNQTSSQVQFEVVTYRKGQPLLKVNKFSLLELFPPMPYIHSFENWIFAPYIDEITGEEKYFTIDFKGYPFKSYKTLNKISRSFCNCNAINIQSESLEGDIRGFLYERPIQLNSINGSFGFRNYNSLRLNLEYLFNWETLSSGLHIFDSSNRDWDELYHVWQYKKTINSVKNFQIILNTLLLNSEGYIANAFRNCSITVQDDDPPLQLGYTLSGNPIKNINIIGIPHLFDNLKFYKYSGATQEEVSIKWDWDLMKAIPNVEDLQQTFSKMWFTNAIPFDFFKSRKEIISNVWVKENGNFKAAQLHQFVYDQHVKNLIGCFEYCRFEEPSFKVEENGIIPGYHKSYVDYTDSTSTKQIVYEYYKTADVFANLIKVSNDEFDDLNKIANYSMDTGDVIGQVIGNSNFKKVTYTNFPLYDQVNINTPFIAPDFFYSCNDENILKADNCFRGCTLQGFIPDHLFKYAKNVSLKNFIKDVLILPKEYGERYDVNKKCKYKICYYIGHNFINSTNIDDYFNFRIALPHDIYQVTEGTPEHPVTIKVTSLHVFCFIDSFNKELTSAKNAFPSRINPPAENCEFIIYNEPNDIYINLMYDHTSEKEVETDKIKIPGKYTVGELGFNLTEYNQLYIDKMYNYLWTQFTFGNMFDKYTTLNGIKIRQTSRENWGIQMGNTVISPFEIGKVKYNQINQGQFGISRNANLPSSTGYNLCLLSVYGLNYDLTKTPPLEIPFRGPQIVSKEQLNDLDLINYNNSRTREEGHSLSNKH